MDVEGSRNRGYDRQIGGRGPHTRNRPVREDSPPPSGGSAPPDERRALRSLWQTWSGGKPKKHDQDQHAQRPAEMKEQGFQLFQSDAILINPQDQLFQVDQAQGTQQQLQNETSSVGVEYPLKKVNQDTVG
jgi:hypothetical protein